MINRDDFKIREIIKSDESMDYWFDVIGVSADDILNRVKEQGVQCVPKVVMGCEGVTWTLGVWTQYMFNCNVLVCEFDDIKSLLIEEINKLNESASFGVTKARLRRVK